MTDPARPVETPGPPGPPAFDRRLLDAVVAVADGLELEPTLRRIVRAAADLTNAPFAALGVLGEDGLHKAFVYTGVSPELASAIGRLPRGHGVLGHITRVGRVVRVNDLAQHPASTGFPEHHPRMKSFLGVPVGIGDTAVGNLYLADKPGGFTVEDEDVVVALAAAAAVAVENAGLYEDVRRREQWFAAAQEVSTAMLSGADEDDALQLIARLSREVAGATTAALVLPGWEGHWVLEVADGEGADQLLGIVMPPEGRAVSAVKSGKGLRSADMSSEPSLLVPELREFGPALYAPLIAGEDHMGVLILLRHVGDPEFADQDLTTAERFAGQAALALQLAEARRRGEEAELLEDRARIARDLHDLVVQELFAMGMRLSRLRDGLEPGVLSDIDSSLDSLDRVVRQIRSTIRALRDPAEAIGLVDRLHGEANRAHAALGFQPDLTIDTHGGADEGLPADLTDDVVAVVREGLSNAARHAQASAVTVRVEVSPHTITVEVGDDGKGLPEHVSRRSGLDNLSERARRHGGTCTADPRAD
ncbi:MAG TPA: GAF domain-containing protein, partial [Kineosporiaceae bacterium]|nr:GAF domain-containing protein [Kineosporiaceae bacterium]